MIKQELLKRLGSIVAGGGLVTTASFGGYKLLSNSKESSSDKKIENKDPNRIAQPKKPEHNPKDIQQLKQSAAKSVASSNLNNGRQIMAQLNTLKSEKGSLLTEISQKITSYKNTIKNVTSVNKLETELNNCFSKDEVITNISQEEKEELKKNYDQIKKDIEKYEKIQTDLTSGEVWKSENYADANNTDESRYTDFNDKFNKTKKEYQTLSAQKPDITFYQSFLKIKEKLTDSTQKCSFKDLIKMNDKLGEWNRSQ